mgnify:CR=1 FL=1
MKCILYDEKQVFQSVKKITSNISINRLEEDIRYSSKEQIFVIAIDVLNLSDVYWTHIFRNN